MITFKDFLEESFKPKKFELPANHKPALKVPKGGSCCANCKWVSKDKTECENEYYFKFYGTEKLPGPADELCSDWWEHK